VSVREENQLPPESTLLGVIDTGARNAMKMAQQAVSPVVTREVPRRSGRTAAALSPRVYRTSTGAALLVAPPRGKMSGKVRISQVVRWVNRGTGLYRTTGLDVQPARRIRSKRIPPRRLILPGGRKVWSVKGQHPNPFMARIMELGTPRVQKACEDGAVETARTVEEAVH